MRSGAPSEEILKVIHEWPRPEMVIMGMQGSVAEEVVLKSERPVMVLGPHFQESYFRLKNYKPLRILIPTDLTRASRPAEQYALSLAARLGAELVFFHSVFDHIARVHEASVVSGFASFDLDRIFNKMTRDATTILENKKQRIKKIIPHCDYKVAEMGQRLTESLLRESTLNYCLIVMGTHSRRHALVRSFIGGTARETILNAEVPVVVVHSH
jgi:nucleotide-binding universal stress UspA family protein